MKLTKDLMRAQARAVKGALAAQGLALRHTNVLDLVAASHGLRDRSVRLPTDRETSPSPSKLLEACVADYARHDADRRAKLMASVAAITHPAPTPMQVVETAKACFEHHGIDVEIPAALIDDPNAWMSSQNGMAWLAKATSGLYHSRYYDHQRSPYDLKFGNKLADDILDNKRQSEPEHPDTVLERHLGEGCEPQESYREQASDDVAQFLDALEEAAEDADLAIDRDEWEDAIRDAICERLAEGDDSSVRDLLGSYDTCEVLFMMGDPDLGYEDNAISSVKPWTGTSTLHPDGHLQKQLASIGWRMAEFLKTAGNTNERGSGVAPRRSPLRKEKLVDYATLAEAVENACSSHFAFCLYAIVPIENLIDLDLTKPISFTKAAFGVYDPLNGAYYDAKTLEDVVVTPKQGRLESPGRWYGPDDICGLVHEPYRARIANVAAAARATAKAKTQ